MDQPDPLLSELCSICHTNPPKYRCPRCATRTCSLPCTRRHKLWSQCSGVRDPAAYLRRNELATESAFDRDFNFITGIERTLERAGRETENRGIELPRGHLGDQAETDGAPGAEDAAPGGKRKHPHQGLVKGEAGFLRGAEAGGVNVVRAPRGMTRNRQNASRWHPKHKCLNWSVEWITAAGEKTVRACLETCSIAEAYDRVYPAPKEVKARPGQLKEEQDVSKEPAVKEDATAPEAASSAPAESTETPVVHPSSSEPVGTGSTAEKQPATDQSIPPHRGLYFYLHRPRTTTKRPVLTPLSPSASLTTALRGHTVLEFPTIYALPDSTATLLAEKETSPFLLEEEYLRTLGPQDADGNQLLEVSEVDAETTGDLKSVDLRNVDENEVMEVLQQELFEPVPEEAGPS
ncbi:uncharacterized protein PFLUO_LOCUS5116 [Penicillium psychrofluorescens]|uniref:uncharacterized protein n=1 Tax=Penicillium psychrofluorescens TaxID=3158075 RepID=UPI003CCE06D1